MRTFMLVAVGAVAGAVVGAVVVITLIDTQLATKADVARLHSRINANHSGRGARFDNEVQGAIDRLTAPDPVDVWEEAVRRLADQPR